MHNSHWIHECWGIEAQHSWNRTSSLWLLLAVSHTHKQTRLDSQCETGAKSLSYATEKQRESNPRGSLSVNKDTSLGPQSKPGLDGEPSS